MGCLIEFTDTGTEVEVHKFDNWETATIYVTKSRGYKGEWRPHWSIPEGFDFFTGPLPGQHASVRREGLGCWRAAFWLVGDVKVTPATPYEGKATWHGAFRVAGQWHVVTNGAGNAIAYASPEAAHAGAQVSLDEVNRNTVR